MAHETKKYLKKHKDLNKVRLHDWEIFGIKVLKAI